MSLVELGNRSYKKAQFGDYKGAITVLDKAIVYFRHDPRVYNNRSYCYCRLKNYEMALKDAEFMVESFPCYARGYYRKAEALAELKSGGKYWVQDAVTALKLTKNDAFTASQFLKIGGRKGTKVPKNEIYFSDEEFEEPSTSTTRMVDKTSKDLDYDPYTDPNNPFNCNSIWVGNVTKKVTSEKLKAIFGRYGKFKGDIIIHQNSCAFVNFTDSKMAAAAMKNIPQNFPVEDTFLVIRYPHRDCKPSNSATNSKKNGIKVR